MAIKEKIDSGTNLPSYGVCFIDTATSELNLCGFVDDAERTTLETLLVQIRPKELVLEKVFIIYFLFIHTDFCFRGIKARN